MDPALDLNVNTEIETPRQEPPKACTRTSRCAQQDCSICCSPNDHVRNLDDAINNSDGRPPASPTSTSAFKLPPPPTNHNIHVLTASFQAAILDNHIFELTAVDSLYSSALKSDMEFHKYDRSDLKLAHKQAQEILNAHTAASTPLPTQRLGPLPTHSSPICQL